MDPTLLSVHRSGQGEPLLLLHGFGSSRRDFTAVLPALSARFDVLSLDLPGVARSPVLGERPTVAALTDAVERTLDAEDVGAVHVFGNSLGGRVAIELARRGRARSVVAVAPSGLSWPPERAFQVAAMSAARLALRPATRAIEPLSRSRLGRFLLMGPLKARPWAASGEEAAGMREGFAESRDYWRTLWWGIAVDVPRSLAGISCPVTLVQGLGDLISGGQTSRYAVAIPGSRFRPLVAAGHAPQSDRPATLVEIVRQTAARATDGATR